MNDLQSVTLAMNAIKSLTNGQAAPLLDKAYAMITAAVEGGAGGVFSAALPGDGTRRTLQTQIRKLLDEANTSTPAVAFSDVAAVKNAIIRACIEENAVAEGNSTLAQARGKFFDDLVDEAKKLPAAIGNAAGQATADLVLSTLKPLVPVLLIIALAGVLYVAAPDLTRKLRGGK